MTFAGGQFMDDPCHLLGTACVRLRCHDMPVEFQLAVSAPSDCHPFAVYVEPEGMVYESPRTGTVVLAFRGPDAMTAELTHRPDMLIVWRPADTEVWATTPDGTCEQIAGWQHIPAPGLDSGGPRLDGSARELIESLFHPKPEHSA